MTDPEPLVDAAIEAAKKVERAAMKHYVSGDDWKEMTLDATVKRAALCAELASLRARAKEAK